jgi:hypothetical protein
LSVAPLLLTAAYTMIMSPACRLPAGICTCVAIVSVLAMPLTAAPMRLTMVCPFVGSQRDVALTQRTLVPLAPQSVTNAVYVLRAALHGEFAISVA